MSEEFNLDFDLIKYDEMPDFEIYSDQLVGIVNTEISKLFPGFEDMMVTSSMVNNYVKHKIMPKPNKKKYSRIHIGYLLTITILKPVLSMDEIKNGIAMAINDREYSQVYDEFSDILKSSYHLVKKMVNDNESISMLDLDKKSPILTMITVSLWSKIYTKIRLKKFESEVANG